MPSLSPRRRLAAAVLVALSLTGLTLPATSASPGAPPSQAARTGGQPLGTTTYQLASINLLGAGHTDGRNPRRGFARSEPRLRQTLAIMNREGIDVAGFQEMHGAQAAQWERERAMDGWGLFPGKTNKAVESHNSITWRKSLFQAIELRKVMIPYFNGREQPMPYVLLRYKPTGQDFWLINVHNPANSAGPAQKWRDEAVRREAALVNRLRKESPRTPVFLTGDMNDRSRFFCPIVSATRMAAANGGFAAPGARCTPPPRMRVDWVLGTAPNTFTGYRDLQDASVRKVTDHPFIIANANIPSATMASSPVNRVVVLTVAGLRGTAVSGVGKANAPNLHRLLAEGSRTLNARTAVESTRSLPNLVSLLTGRRAARGGGHGVTTNVGTRRTIHGLAGRYVSSVFGFTHNLGRRTTFLSSAPRSGMVLRSYDAANGGGDRYGRDNGDDKIDRGAIYRTDAQVARALNTQLRSAPAALSVVEYTQPERAGERYGFTSGRYVAALRGVDRLIGSTMRTINGSRTLNGRTLLVVTGLSGGTGHSNTNREAMANYRVPIIVSGPGVQPGGDLYGLNPAWTSPGRDRVGYASTPIFVADVANLVEAALRQPALPGSQLNRGQRLSPWRR